MCRGLTKCGDHAQPRVWWQGAAGPDTAAAPTHFSMHEAASHLRRWAPLILVSAGFFWWERLSCWSAPMLQLSIAFVWYVVIRLQGADEGRPPAASTKGVTPKLL